MAIFNRIRCPNCKRSHDIRKNKKQFFCKKCGQFINISSHNSNYYIEYYCEDRRIRECVGLSRQLAVNALRKRKLEIVENKFLDKKKQEKIKFEDFSAEFLNIHSKVVKKSWKSDYFNLIALKKHFSGKYLYTITVRDIDKYIAQRSQVVSPATVNRELATLKTLLNKAVIWGKLSDTPAKSIKFLKETNGRLRFLEKEEIIKLLSNCSSQLKPIVILALFTGMRRGEILGLKWHDVDFKRDIIYLYNTKNHEKREIHMNKYVKSALENIRKHPESQYILCNKNGEPFNNVTKSFFTALRKSGINNFRFHDLRHTFASQLVMSGVDINTVRELMGHKDIRMTLRYSHLSPNHKKQAVDTLGSLIDINSTPLEKEKISKNTQTIETIVI